MTRAHGVRRGARAIAALAVVCTAGGSASVLGVSAGCGQGCPPFERIALRGNTYRNGSEQIYETSPDSGPFQPFEGALSLRIQHNLGVRPTWVMVWLSFNEYPGEPAKGGYAPAAGNQAVILQSGPQDVVVKNDSCASYFVRVVVGAIDPGDGGVDAADGADSAAGG